MLWYEFKETGNSVWNTIMIIILLILNKSIIIMYTKILVDILKII